MKKIKIKQVLNVLLNYNDDEIEKKYNAQQQFLREQKFIYIIILSIFIWIAFGIEYIYANKEEGEEAAYIVLPLAAVSILCYLGYKYKKQIKYYGSILILLNTILLVEIFIQIQSIKQLNDSFGYFSFGYLVSLIILIQSEVNLSWYLHSIYIIISTEYCYLRFYTHNCFFITIIQFTLLIKVFILYKNEKISKLLFFELNKQKNNFTAIKELMNKTVSSSIIILGFQQGAINDVNNQQKICVKFVNEHCRQQFKIKKKQKTLEAMGQIILKKQIENYQFRKHKKTQQTYQRSFPDLMEEDKPTQKMSFISQRQIHIPHINFLPSQQLPYSVANNKSIIKQLDSLQLNKQYLIKDIDEAQKSQFYAQQNKKPSNPDLCFSPTNNIGNKDDLNNGKISINLDENNKQAASLQISEKEVGEPDLNNPVFTLFQLTNIKMRSYLFKKSLQQMMQSQQTQVNQSQYDNSTITQRDKIFYKCIDNQQITKFFDIEYSECIWKNQPALMLTINDLTDNINMQREKLISKFKDQQLASISHDLRSPLNSMILLLQASELNHEIIEIKDNISMSIKIGQLLQSFINDLLDYQQIKQGTIQIRPSKFYLRQSIEDVISICKFQAEDKNIILRSEYLIQDPQLYIFNDSLRIQQILINLVTNAIKFTQQGSIIILVEEDEKCYENLYISVKDTGSGIPQHIMKNLFKPYSTFEHSGCGNKKGVGLGLYICNNIAKLIGPQKNIKVKSKIKQGSTFTFVIYTNLEKKKKRILSNSNNMMNESKNIQSEIVQKKQKIDEAEISYQDSERRSRQLIPLANNVKSLKNIQGQERKSATIPQILIVDDTQFNITVLKIIFNKLNICYDIGNNGQQGLQQVVNLWQQQGLSYKLILMDLEMPLMDGYEAIKQIREFQYQNNFNELVSNIYILSGNEINEEAQLLGANGYLKRPFTYPELQKLLMHLKII